MLVYSNKSKNTIDTTLNLLIQIRLSNLAGAFWSNNIYFHQSVLNGDAGKPSLLYKFAPSGLSAQA